MSVWCDVLVASAWVDDLSSIYFSAGAITSSSEDSRRRRAG